MFNSQNTRAMVMAAVLVSLSFVLNQITLFRMPYGGSVTLLSMLPIVLAGYFFGVRRGVLAGMCVGILDLIFFPFVIHPVQMLLDYPIAYGVLAVGAVCRDNEKLPLVKAYLIGVACRYLCNVLSGIIFFAEYVGDGFSLAGWSFFYNITYVAPEAAITVAVLCIPAVRKTFDTLKERVNKP